MDSVAALHEAMANRRQFSMKTMVGIGFELTFSNADLEQAGELIATFQDRQLAYPNGLLEDVLPGYVRLSSRSIHEKHKGNCSWCILLD